MSQKKDGYLIKVIKYRRKYVTIYLSYGFDLTHGKGWFCQSFALFNNERFGNGFHKKNKFTAVRQSLNDLLIT